MSSPDDQSIRQSVRQLRRKLTPIQQQQAAQQVCQLITQHHKIDSAQSIAIFISFDGEIDTQPIINWCWQHNKAVYLPILHPFSKGHLLFTRYHSNTKLVINCFGIPQPVLDIQQIIPTNQLDIIFTPLVAFDYAGHRLGMGGGFYDRTLQNWKNSRVYPIGLAHDCQLVKTIEQQEWDIPLPEIITPSRCWQWPEPR